MSRPAPSFPEAAYPVEVLPTNEVLFPPDVPHLAPSGRVQARGMRIELNRFGAAVRLMRGTRSQADMAAAMRGVPFGISKTAIGALEAGQINTDLPHVAAYLSTLGCVATYLLAMSHPQDVGIPGPEAYAIGPDNYQQVAGICFGYALWQRSMGPRTAAAKLRADADTVETFALGKTTTPVPVSVLVTRFAFVGTDLSFAVVAGSEVPILERTHSSLDNDINS